MLPGGNNHSFSWLLCAQLKNWLASPLLESVLTWGYGSHKVFVLSGFEDGQQAGGRAEMGTDAFYLVFGKSNTFPPVPCAG